VVLVQNEPIFIFKKTSFPIDNWQTVAEPVFFQDRDKRLSELYPFAFILYPLRK